MHQRHHFSFTERIVCSLYVGKRRLIRLAFSFIIYMSYNAAFHSILYVNVLKRRFSVLLTAWVHSLFCLYSLYLFIPWTRFLPIILSTPWTPFHSVALSIPLTSCAILIPSLPLLVALLLPSLLYVFPVLSLFLFTVFVSYDSSVSLYPVYHFNSPTSLTFSK